MKDILPADYQGYTAPEPAAPHENPLHIVHRYLRGRYKWAALLGFLFAVPLGVGGYLAVAPIYQSTGIVRIAPTIQTKLYGKELEEAKVPPLFESLVATQASLLRSRRVLDNAVTDPKLIEAGWPRNNDGLGMLIKNLEVSNRAAPELITATVKHRNPVMAQAAVNAVLEAYEKVYEESGSINYTAKEKAIGDRKAELAGLIESKKRQIREFAMKYATDDLDDLHQSKVAELARLNRELRQLDLSLVNREKQPDGKDPEAPQQVSEAMKESVTFLAEQDAVLARLVDEERSLVTSIDAMKLSKGPRHREVISANQRLEAVRNQITARAEVVRQLPRALDAEMTSTASMTIEQVRERRDRYLRLSDETLGAANEIQSTKLAINALKDEIADRKKELDDTSQTLERIRFEGAALAMGRMGIFQRGELPIEPYTDRRLPLAVMGVFAGFALGTGIMLLTGMVRGGFRYIDDIERTEGAAVPLLGTVPDLAGGGVEQEQMAALSVHHLRNMLQLQFETVPGGKVYTITSASAGDGKTSLAIALAMSFAASGRRTIIVDTDLVGRGLTRQLELSGKPGLCEAFNTDHLLNGEVHQTKVQLLWALPCGVTRGFVPEHLSRTVMARIIAQLREEYDAIVLDTGPILGSLEANVVAPASDGVVLVVSRGQNTKVVHASIQRLRRLGANISGLIFNRATARDFERSVSTASVSARSVQAAAAPKDAPPSNPGRASLLRALEAPAHTPAPESPSA